MSAGWKNIGSEEALDILVIRSSATAKVKTESPLPMSPLFGDRFSSLSQTSSMLAHPRTHAKTHTHLFKDISNFKCLIYN